MARSDDTSPSRSTTRAVGRPKRPAFATSTETSSPSSASLAEPAGTLSSEPRRSMGMTRTSSPRLRTMPSAVFGRRSSSLMTRAVKPSPSGSGVRRASMRSPMPGARSDAALLRIGRDDDARRRARFLVPLDRDGDQLALVVDPLDREKGDGRQVARAA